MDDFESRRARAQILVRELYGVLLQREPDLAGEAMFVHRLLAGCTLAEVTKALISSEEYNLLQKSTADFVRDLYCALLGREIAPADVIFDWCALEQAQGRLSMFEVFTAMPEAVLSGASKPLD